MKRAERRRADRAMRKLAPGAADSLRHKAEMRERLGDAGAIIYDALMADGAGGDDNDEAFVEHLTKLLAGSIGVQAEAVYKAMRILDNADFVWPASQDPSDAGTPAEAAVIAASHALHAAISPTAEILLAYEPDEMAKIADALVQYGRG